MDVTKKPIDVVDITPFLDPPPPPKTAAYYPTAPIDRDTDSYDFTNPNRGKAIIFNHREFLDKGYATRNGTMKDAERLETELKKLHFDVESYIDLTGEEVQNVVDRTSQMDHKNNDCILFVILSHGHLGAFTTHDSIFLLDDLYNAFTADKCKSLAGKPKIFIIQACRIDQNDPVDKGVIFGDKSSRVSSRALKDYTDMEKRKRQMHYSLPSHSDFLVVYSTSPGFYSFRSENGSHFIQALCKQLNANATKLPMYSILTNVNRFIATTFEANSDDDHLTGAKQMPCLHSTLTRTLQFNDKTPENQDSAGSRLLRENSTQTELTLEEVDGGKGICSRIANAFSCFR